MLIFVRFLINSDLKYEIIFENLTIQIQIKWILLFQIFEFYFMKLDEIWLIQIRRTICSINRCSIFFFNILNKINRAHLLKKSRQTQQQKNIWKNNSNQKNENAQKNNNNYKIKNFRKSRIVNTNENIHRF